jgi:glycosyltransferase involved in cell wall biosynthesis
LQTEQHPIVAADNRGAQIRVLELRSVRGTGGGPEKTILYGAACAKTNRIAVTVCYLRDARDTTFGIDARAAGLPIAYQEIRERHSFDPSVWPALLRVVREGKFDIVHSHEYKSDLLALALGRMTGVMPLATAHGWTGHSWRERRLYYPADRFLLRWFPRVVAVSSEIRDTLIHAGVRRDRVTTVPNGIDPDMFRRDRCLDPVVRAELGVRPGARVIGAVGRLEPQKRFDVLLEAFARARRRRPELKLFIVGDGSQRGAIADQAAALGIDDAVRLLGHRHDIARLHHAFDLFVQSADYEGTPNAVLEAMALENPVIATDAGGTRDILRDGLDGVIVPCGNAAALADAVECALIDHESATARAAEARRRVEDHLSFARRTQRLELIYQEMADSQATPPDVSSIHSYAKR